MPDSTTVAIVSGTGDDWCYVQINKPDEEGDVCMRVKYPNQDDDEAFCVYMSLDETRRVAAQLLNAIY